MTQAIQDSSGPDVVTFHPAECATQDFTIEDQDHNSGLHSQDLVHDSRLNIIHVNQDLSLFVICTFNLFN